jgi:hypothetical protein
LALILGKLGVIVPMDIKYNVWLHFSKYIQRGQKGYKMLNITNQNYKFIYVYPFETIVILASFFFPPIYKFQEIQIKNPFHLILSLG